MATVISTYLTVTLIFLLLSQVNCKPERGQWDEMINKDKHLLWFVKSVYQGTSISVGVMCNDASTDVKMDIEWVLRRSPCAQEYIGLNTTYAESYLKSPDYLSPVYSETEYLKNTIKAISCQPGRFFWFDPYNYTKLEIAGQLPSNEKKSTEKADVTEVSTTASKVKREASVNPGRAATEFVSVWKDGYYVLILNFKPADESQPLPDSFAASVNVKMRWHKDNYISAGDHPLLIFYGVMGLVYIGYGLFWLVMLACNWKDLLRVQFWIGGVIFLGMLEKAVFFAEYENISKDGRPVKGAIILAELVSCVKRGLARMLVIIVCLGFGIIKPRLGKALHQVLLVGAVFIGLASIEGCMRQTKERPDQSTEWMFAAVPLAVTDAIICWWVFSALLQTTRTLRLRRNVVKLGLYRHFTNTLIFAIVASIAYMIWFLTQHRFKACITDWKELWVDEAFWHLLFSVVLFIIMLLWRPTANNQRYAFSPLLDAAEDGDEEEDDTALSEAYEGMKMRTTKAQPRGAKAAPAPDAKLEDDLKWVEDNIPSSLADKLLPALDSDEEIMNQKFEASKME